MAQFKQSQQQSSSSSLTTYNSNLNSNTMPISQNIGNLNRQVKEKPQFSLFKKKMTLSIQQQNYNENGVAFENALKSPMQNQNQLENFNIFNDKQKGDQVSSSSESFNRIVARLSKNQMKNVQEYQNSKQIPLGYQSVNSNHQFQQSNSECQPGRKTKPRTFQIEEQANFKKVKRTQLKRSFEDSNQSPSQSVSNKASQRSNNNMNQNQLMSLQMIHPINFKDAVGEKSFKPHRPSLGNGQSPQASSTSSKYCFSNRSSNLSNKQLIPEPISHKPFNNQDIVQISELKRSTDFKYQPIKRSYNLINNHQLHKKPRQNQISPAQRLQIQRQSPQRLHSGIPQVSLTIADERLHSREVSKQMPIETPKFNQYYTLLGKQNIVKVATKNTMANNLKKIDSKQGSQSQYQYVRSKSLIKNQCLTSSLIGSNQQIKEDQVYYFQHLNDAGLNMSPNNNAYDQELQNHFTRVLSNEQIETLNQEDKILQLENLDQTGKIKKHNHLFVQSHSSLSQHNDADPQVVTVQYLVDRLSGSIEIDHPRKSFKKDSKKSNKVIKLKKSDIKFQKIEAEKKNNQNQVIQGYQSNQRENFMNNNTKQQLSSPLSKEFGIKNRFFNQSEKKHLVLESNSYQILGGGVMIGSPKMQQRQQEAKFEQDSSVMSSHSSYNSQEEREFELLEDDEIKISCVKAEKQINKIQFSKDPVKSYQIFLEQEKDDSQEIQYNRIRSIQQVRKSSDPTTADSLKSLQSNKNPITKVKSQVKQLQENHDLQTLRQMNNQSNNTIQQIHYKREKERMLVFGKEFNVNSAATTHRENYTSIAKTRLQEDINQGFQNNIHFSNAKQEFLEISGAKQKQQKTGQKYNQPVQGNFRESNKLNDMLSLLSSRNDSSPANPQTSSISSINKEGQHPNLDSRHNLQLSNSVNKSNILYRQSNLAVKSCPGQLNLQFRIFNKNNQNLLKSLAYFVLNNQENMNEILSHLKEEEMCRLSIVIRSKELGQIQRLFGRQHCGMALKQSQEQMIKIWQIKHIPRIITCELSQYYSQISRALSQHDFEIEKDIDRTYPNDVNFTKNHPNHQKMLRILRATAYHIPQVGYVQGFNFIVGALIKMINNEEQVFWMFVNILSFRELFKLYTEGMPLFKMMQFYLNCFVQNLLPEIELYLSKKGILIEYFSSQWILTLFSFEFELDFFRNFITNLLQHGPQYILQLSLALIEYISKDLLKFKQMEDAMEYLKDFQVQNKLPIQQIFTRALEFTQVTPARLVELQKIYKTSRSNKRILFVKDQDKDVTYLKTLPNLPDDEQMTECNVDQDSIDEESDEYSELEQNKNQGRSQNFKKSQKNQINTSFHPNNVSSSMDVRPASGLDSIKNQYGKVVELKCDQTDNIVSQNDYNQRNIAFYQDSCESRLDLNQQDPYTSQYLTNESQDLTRAARVFKKINSSDRLDQNYTSNKSIESTDPTPIYQFQKSKFQQNFIISKGSLEQEQISHIIQDQEIKKQRIQKSKNINIIEQSIKSNKKVPQELLDMITKRRFLHSPSVENLKSSFKLDQKQNSKISLNISMNSENLLESEHKNNKQYEFSEYESKIKKLNNVDSEVNLIQQLRQEEDLNRIIDESHNISNIEEFYENLEYDSVNDKFQNTQKYTSRRDQREDLSERETLKLSWTKSKPLHQQLQLQFEINKNGSHLNTPHFQQSNRSNTKNQDQKKYNQGSSFDVKKSSALISKNLKSYENHDPNTNKIESYRESGLNIKINQSIRKQPSIQNLHQQNQYNEELRIVFEDNDQIKSINNFQRFTATQKNPTKQQMKNMERQKNRILHNWSANHPNVRNSQDIERVSSRNSNKNIDEVIVSMKNKHQILQQKSIQQPNSSRLANKVSLKSSQNLGYNQAPLSSRDEGKDGGTSHRSLFGQTLQFGYLNVGSSVDIEFSIKNTNKLVQLQNSNHKQVQNYHHQPSNSLGGKSVQSSSSSMMFNRSQKLQINNTIIPNQQAQQVKNCGILSPRTGINNNKHSKQLVVHKGDNYFEEGDMTTLMTPKDSFYVGSTKQNIKTTN